MYTYLLIVNFREEKPFEIYDIIYKFTSFILILIYFCVIIASVLLKYIAFNIQIVFFTMTNRFFTCEMMMATERISQPKNKVRIVDEVWSFDLFRSVGVFFVIGETFKKNVLLNLYSVGYYNNLTCQKFIFALKE